MTSVVWIHIQNNADFCLKVSRQKLGTFLQSKWVQKLNLSKNDNVKNCSPNLTSLQNFI